MSSVKKLTIALLSVVSIQAMQRVANFATLKQTLEDSMHIATLMEQAELQRFSATTIQDEKDFFSQYIKSGCLRHAWGKIKDNHYFLVTMNCQKKGKMTLFMGSYNNLQKIKEEHYNSYGGGYTEEFICPNKDVLRFIRTKGTATFNGQSIELFK